VGNGTGLPGADGVGAGKPLPGLGSSGWGSLLVWNSGCGTQVGVLLAAVAPQPVAKSSTNTTADIGRRRTSSAGTPPVCLFCLCAVVVGAVRLVG
jgi:hypothetical protein